MSHKPTLARIRIYPVKSLGGFDRDVWELDALGLRYDRRWMVVGPDGRFMTQRDFPGMAEIAVEMQADRLILSVPMRSPVAVPLEPEPGASEPVTIWGDTVAARAVSEDANRWLGEVLQTPCRLVYMPDEAARSVDSQYVKHNAQVAFADGFPLLLTSEESLAELNRRLADPVPMDRFRPNLVVRGIGDPHAEDTWRRIRFSDMEFHVVKPCSRCVIVTTDQVTGERGTEPLETLATYRSAGGEVYFGQNLVHLGHGRIRVGDDIQVLEAGDPVPVPETGKARASGGRSAPSAEKTSDGAGPLGAPAEPAFELYLPESDEDLEFEPDLPAKPEPDLEPSTEAGTDSEAEGEAEEEAAKQGMDDIIFPFEVDLVVTPEDLKEAAMEDEAAKSEASPEEVFEAALEASFGPGVVEEKPVDTETDTGPEEPAPEEALTEEPEAEVAADEAVAEEPESEEEVEEEATEEEAEEEEAEEEEAEEEEAEEEEAEEEEAEEEEAEEEEAEEEEAKEEAPKGKRKKRPKKGKGGKATVDDIEFELGGRPEGAAITGLYEAAGRPEVAGDQDPGRIERAFAASNVVVAAWLGKVLVGVLRGWSDGARDGFISDLVVHPDHVGAGIGVEMVQHAMNAHPGIRWVLRASATSPYLGSSLGWTHLGGGWFVSPP